MLAEKAGKAPKEPIRERTVAVNAAKATSSESLIHRVRRAARKRKAAMTSMPFIRNDCGSLRSS